MIVWLSGYLAVAVIVAIVAWCEIAPTDPGAVFPFPKWPEVLAAALFWPAVAVFWIIDKLRGRT